MVFYLYIYICIYIYIYIYRVPETSRFFSDTGTVPKSEWMNWDCGHTYGLREPAERTVAYNSETPTWGLGFRQQGA